MTSLISCDYIFMWYPQVTVIAGIQLQLNARVGATPTSLREFWPQSCIACSLCLQSSPGPAVY